MKISFINIKINIRILLSKFSYIAYSQNVMTKKTIRLESLPLHEASLVNASHTHFEWQKYDLLFERQSSDNM